MTAHNTKRPPELRTRLLISMWVCGFVAVMTMPYPMGAWWSLDNGADPVEILPAGLSPLICGTASLISAALLLWFGRLRDRLAAVAGVCLVGLIPTYAGYTWIRTCLAAAGY